MTGEEFIFLNRHALQGSGTKPAQPAADKEKKYVYGIGGIARLFGCSIPTANRIKKSGRINRAITQIGRKIIVDADMALELAGRTEERPYFYKSQVEKVKAIQALLTQDLTKKYTLEELSEQFDIALTPMKTCFKSVYGSPIFTYMRNYRMNVAASLLRSDKSLKVAEIAGLVGYDSPSKFAAAFHQVMGKTPLEYRKSMN